ncbi:hypothetical protein [Parabacteroides sp. FAFU027]|uniref:hypothetical protein n=1 Tax=Parabacteroides sp. FAFU027 TaxID=2922715 RepID=UPI001FAEBE00|nr:hypothetical protein [Parabacteroides sp. FAFU027]
MRKYPLHIIAIILLLISAAGCNKSGQAHPSVIYTTENALIVDSSCVIFVAPDTTEIARMHAQNSEEDYQAWVDQMTWYPGIARTALHGMGINTMTVHDKKYLVLNLSKKEEFVMNPKKISGDMVLFNKKKKPFVVNSADFDANKGFILKYFDK